MRSEKQALALVALKFDMDEYDKWAWCMSWLFDLCGEIHFNRDFDVPDSFGYRPSPLAHDNSDADEWHIDVMKELDDNQIAYAASVMLRYSKKLEQAGESY